MNFSLTILTDFALSLVERGVGVGGEAFPGWCSISLAFVRSPILLSMKVKPHAPPHITVPPMLEYRR